MAVSKHVCRQLLAVAVVGLALGGRSVAAGEGITAFPESHQALTFIRGGETYLELGLGGWGPKWAWLGFRGTVAEADGKTVATSTTTVRSSGAKLTVRTGIAKAGPRQLTLDINVSTSKDTDLTYLMTGVHVHGRRFAQGKVLVTLADGTSKTVAMPLARKGLGTAVGRFVLVDNAGEQTSVTLEPPLDVGSDGDGRIILANRLAADKPVQARLTVDLPAPVTYYASGKQVPDDPGFAQWYTFTPSQDYAKASEVSLADWLEKPAGKHGRIVRKDDDLVYNGKQIKLWGLNLCYGDCSPKKELADLRAAFYAKNGVNAVRLHKYADGPGWAGIQSAESFAELDPAGLARLDYFIAQLKAKGIYVKLSSTFGVKLGPADRKTVPYMNEFGALKGGKGRVATGHGSVFLSPEIQDLQIRQIVNLLKHRNAHTGLTYAEEPAVAVVELFNEDSALWFGTLGRLQRIPTLRKRAAERFCTWLEAKYGSKDALLKAWGRGALGSFANEGFRSESWEDKTIVPAGNPWFYDPAQLAGSQKPKRQRLLDTMRFLYEIQNEFYDRYVKAIRETGYEGEILGSNWQAGRAMSHYYNLHSDARVGLIDRHNYFGGGGGAKINNLTMLRVPGSAMLSAGMQQVADRPFMLSEWIHVTPNEWGVEGPAIIGAYGMGLNGWDVSFMFQNRDPGGFSTRIAGSQWDVAAPNVMGVFPAVARQVLRGDVRQSDVVATRYVHVPSLLEGKLGFDDKVTQQYDVKTFDSDKVPARTLAAARCVVEFVDAWRETPAFDLSRYVADGVTTSSTGQLRWKEGAERLDGYFTIDSPGTKAVVGFAAGQTCALGDVTIAPKSRFGAIYVTARDRDKDIASAGNLLIVAVARARNTGMRVFLDSRILNRGKAPVVMEPIQARIEIRRKGSPTVHVLDHDGCKTGRTLPVRNGAIEIDGARDKTCYYLVSY